MHPRQIRETFTPDRPRLTSSILLPRRPREWDRPGPRGSSALDGAEIALGRTPHDVAGPGLDDPLAAREEGEVDPIVPQRVQARDDVADRRGVQRDVVGIAVHERDLLRV